MSTHAPTPGPWTTKRSRHGGYAVECRGRLTNPSSTAVCSVRVHPRTPEADAEAAATARLIAEAPNLLKLLKECRKALGIRDDFAPLGAASALAPAIDAAIARVEGES